MLDSNLEKFSFRLRKRFSRGPSRRRHRVPRRSHADVTVANVSHGGGLGVSQRLNDASRDSPDAEVLLAPVEDLAGVLLGHRGRSGFRVGIKVLVAVDQFGVACGELHISRTGVTNTVPLRYCWTFWSSRGSTAALPFTPAKEELIWNTIWTNTQQSFLVQFKMTMTPKTQIIPRQCLQPAVNPIAPLGFTSLA